MELTPQLPPLPTLTLNTTILNDPPDKPPDPSISILFPENTQYRAPANPFRGPLSHKLEREHKEALQDALSGIRAPFFFELEEPIRFEGARVGVDTTTENFNAAVITVIAAIERGYYSSRDPTPLGPTDWARLSCATIAAVGRGYHRQYTTEHESLLEKVRAEAVDPNPLTKNPSLFHRLSAIASDVSDHVSSDQEGYQDWYLTLKKEFTEKATKAAAAEVEEKWLLWKANEIDRLANEYKQEIACNARKGGIDYFIETAQRVGLHISRDGDVPTAVPTPSAGRKRSLSGTFSNAGLATPTAKRIMPSGPTPSQEATPCAIPIPTQATNGNLNLDAITAVIKAAMGPAIESAMAPYVAKISALEKATKPPQTAQEVPHRTAETSPPLKGVGASMWAPTESGQHTDTGTEGFMPVTRKGRGKKAKGGWKADGPTPAQPPQTNTAPTSYANAAATVANNKQLPLSPPRLTRHYDSERVREKLSPERLRCL